MRPSPPLFCCLPLFSWNPDNCYLNYAFNLKMDFLVLAIIFNYAIHRSTMGDKQTRSVTVSDPKICISFKRLQPLVKRGHKPSRVAWLRRLCCPVRSVRQIPC